MILVLGWFEELNRLCPISLDDVLPVVIQVPACLTFEKTLLRILQGSNVSNQEC